MLPRFGNMEGENHNNGDGDAERNPELIRLLIEGGQERKERMAHLQDLVTRQSDALDRLATHVTAMTTSLKEATT